MQGLPLRGLFSLKLGTFQGKGYQSQGNAKEPLKIAIKMGCRIILLTLLALSMASVAFAVDTAETVSYITFDDAQISGSDSLDISGNGYDLTNNGAATSQAGVINEGYTFSSSDWAQMDDISIWKGAGGAISLWFKRADTDSYEYIAAQSAGSNPQWYLGIGSGANDGKLVYYMNFGSSMYVYSNNAWDDGAYHHVVANKNGTSLTLWIDGNPDANLTVSASYDNERILEIGSRAGGSNGNFQGSIDELFVINRTLSQQEIIDLYSSGNGLQYPFVTTYSVNLTLRNDSDVDKWKFKEGEDFRVYADFWENTGTPVVGGTCNFTLQDGIIEQNGATINTSICTGGGCFSDTVEDAFTITKQNNLSGSQMIHFGACHSQPPGLSIINVTVFCSLGKESFIVPNTAFGFCSDGDTPIFIDTTVCLEEPTDISVNLTVNGFFPQYITNVQLDQVYPSLFIPGIYNATNERYHTGQTHEYYTHGLHNISVNCSDGSLSAFAENETIIVNIPPTVKLNFIDVPDSGEIYPPLGDIPFAVGVWNFSALYADDDIDSQSFTIKNGSGATLYSHPGNSTLNVSSNVFVDFGNPYSITLFANDTFGNETTAVYYFNVTDLTNPVCAGLNGISVNTPLYLYNFSVACSDSNFFSFNISCTNGFNYSIEGLNVESYLFQNQTLLNSSTVCQYRYCDGHTAEALQEWFIRPKGDTIEFEQAGKVNKLKSLDGGEITYTKETDRIAFKLSLDELSPLGTRLEYTTSPHAYYFQSLKYPGWIVDAEALTWFDLAQEYPGYTVKVNRWNQTTWLIDVIPPKDLKEGPVELEFHSIGELNCVSGSMELNLTSIPESPKKSKIRPPLTTAGVLVLFFLYALWLAFVLMTYLIKGPNNATVQIFNLAQLVIALLTMIYVYKTFNGLLGMLTILTAIGIFAAKAFHK